MHFFNHTISTFGVNSAICFQSLERLKYQLSWRASISARCKLDSVPVVCQKPSSIFIIERDMFIRHFLGEGLKEQGHLMERNHRMVALDVEQEFGVSRLFYFVYSKSDYTTYSATKHSRQHQPCKHKSTDWFILFSLSPSDSNSILGCRCLFSVEIWINFIFQVRAQICRFSRHARLGDFNKFFRCFRARINEYKLWQRNLRWSQKICCAKIMNHFAAVSYRDWLKISHELTVIRW